ncbi:hypothetical protein Cs7R123_39240 [Catellatospora sp. TT07R-123]|uniref:cell wall-binding repeat-containing protein n=1 Tax=Catellatospora sp. TT07R-123 TaxID=2733863 RepID=UPI001B0AE4EA|nr:cell wall-binding repeat-containing protein [Catellatospora sp. TT07R-123]GHJ46582.1 hypothetical protein Cs7R123_39240 [Catellatospora sp. TT07R-123]
MNLPHRRPLAAAAMAAALLGTVFAAPADASHPSASGTSSTLTAVDGGRILLADGTSLAAPQWCFDGYCYEDEPLTVSDLQWSADGSRAAFADQRGRIVTVRYDDPQGATPVVDSVSGHYTDPTFVGDGGTLVYSDGTVLYRRGYDVILGSRRETISPAEDWQTGGTYFTDPDGGPDGRVAVQRQPAKGGAGPQVWLWDGSGSTEADYRKLADGANPAFSPDGTRVAYVSGGHIWTVKTDGTGAVRIDTDATAAYDDPTWSGDGATIAFRDTASGRVRTVAAAGGASAPTALTGIPAYRSQQRGTVARLTGRNRFETATAVAQSYWATAGAAGDRRRPAKAVVLGRSDDFADSLGGSALAAAKQGPLLLTPPTSLNPATATEIKRVLGANTTATVYLLGSTGALSAQVEAAIRAFGYRIVRLAGTDRYDTAVKIADAIDPTPDIIMAATGRNFPDGLAAGAAAGSLDVPGGTLSAVVVLTNDTALPAATKKYLDTHPAERLGIGVQAVRALSAGAYQPWPFQGTDRYHTASMVASAFFGHGPRYVGLATGTNWPDALAGGALMGAVGGPLLLTPGTASAVNRMPAAFLSGHSPAITTGLVFGGVVAEAQLKQFGTLISGPAGSTAVGSIQVTAAPAPPANKQELLAALSAR